MPAKKEVIVTGANSEIKVFDEQLKKYRKKHVIAYLEKLNNHYCQIIDANNRDFAQMALENRFSGANYEYVASKPLQEYTPLVSIGDVTVYEHTRRHAEFYVVDGVKAEQKYSTYPVDIRAFKNDYFYLMEALLDKRLYYSSAYVKVKFERVWGL